MVTKIKNSIRYALAGQSHAFRTEFNLKLFLSAYVISLLGALPLRLDLTQWALLVFSGGMFLTVEMINTALERFTDAFDRHTKGQNDIHFDAIKLTKDIAAGASLIAGGVWVLVLAILYLPNMPLFRGL